VRTAEATITQLPEQNTRPTTFEIMPFNSPGGSTIQRDAGRGLPRLAPLIT